MKKRSHIPCDKCNLKGNGVYRSVYILNDGVKVCLPCLLKGGVNMWKETLKRIREIDPEAADYLESDAKKLTSYADNNGHNNLASIMKWDETPQGKAYWQKIEALI